MAFMLSTLCVCLLAVAAALAVLQYALLLRKRRHLPGPAIFPPFIGNLHKMLLEPFKFYEAQERFGPLSWNTFFGLFIVFAKDSELTRRIFANSKSFNLWLTGGARYILGDDNIAFLTGDPHKRLRRRLLPLFTPRALSVYIPLQEAAIRTHITQWVSAGADRVELRPLARDLNLATSQRIFLGHYLTPARRAQFQEHYWKMNEGFLSFPVPIPGNTLWYAMKARERVIDILHECVLQSKAKLGQGGAPDCLLDLWMENELSEYHDDQIDEREAALHLLDFLFAAQDASTSSLVWACTLLADHPDVFRRVRDEQYSVRPNDEAFSLEMIERLSFTQQVAREVLRFRPPATMVPHVALEDTPLTDSYTVPKGAVLLPSIWCASFEGWEEPLKFDPDRFGPERREQDKHGKNFLVFGYGPHYCLGKTYALNHLTMFLSVICRNYTWKRHSTPGGDDIVFLPTIFPKDGCVMTLQLG